MKLFVVRLRQHTHYRYSTEQVFKFLMGGDLGELGDGPPKKLRWGTAHVFIPPNISRSSVIGCVAKYELTKKGVMEEFIVLKYRIFVKKRVIIGYI